MTIKEEMTAIWAAFDAAKAKFESDYQALQLRCPHADQRHVDTVFAESAWCNDCNMFLGVQLKISNDG